MNKIITFGYSLFLVAPLAFISVACYSYFSILNVFGKVPPYEEGVSALVKEKGIPVKIFPIEYGDVVLSILLYAVLFFPVYILLNYLLYKRNPLFKFPIKIVLILILEYVVTILLLVGKSPLNWYAGFIFD